uniref:Uncharacterized protein n=1 Tax=Rhizophora mucronata TaxID=61149 RepID=A0A2P2PIW3_RHIMU
MELGLLAMHNNYFRLQLSWILVEKLVLILSTVQIFSLRNLDHSHYISL